MRAPALLMLFVGTIAMPAALRAGEAIVDLYVEIPTAVALDVRGDLVFDLSKLPGPSSPNDCENVFPPGSACKVATYDPTGGRTVTVSVFDNSDSGNAVVEEKVAPSWSRATPGQIATTGLQARAPNDVSGKTTQPLKITPAALSRTPADARWVTVTRSFRFVAPVSSLLETPKEGIQTTITYSVSHAE